MKTVCLVHYAIVAICFMAVTVFAQNPYPSTPQWKSADEKFTMSVATGDLDNDGDMDAFVASANGGIRFFRNTTGDTSAVSPRQTLDPLHGIEFSIGPNPANPITWISYNLPYPQKAEIAVYNLLGQKVATLASGLQMPGQNTLIWNAANYASGQYFIRLETESPNAGLGTIRLQSMVERVVVVK